MGSVYGKKFDKVARFLRKEFPLGVPVVVRTVEKLRCVDSGDLLFGACYSSTTTRGKTKKFVIEVARGLSLDTAIDTLMHEWAHATDQLENGTPERRPHRDSWGAHYARIWRVYTGEK
tara:strand:+ start:379 stop:732 length:354 start_codon:yes stop_codon:yes gene_type:complete